MERPQRLLAILTVLQSGRRTTAADLAGQFAVSKRTILRDIDALAEADVPVVAERGRYGGISLVYAADVDVARLSDRETEALGLVGLDVARARELGLEAHTRGAARKLSTRAPWPGTPGTGGTAADGPSPGLSDLVAIDTAGWFDAERAIEAGSLLDALRRGHRLSLWYRTSGRTDAERLIVDPHGLYSRGGRWYLIAEVDARPRMFALTRLESWRELDESKEVRSSAPLAEVAANLVSALEQRRDVVVTALLDTATEDLARRILGSRLLSVEPFDACGRGADDSGRQGLKITVGYDEVDGVRQLIQFADHIEILDPPEARALVRGLSEDLAARHGDDRP
ncbi:WYL domain-containing protein [Brevibacterium casei]|nr:WYL domain-containing protein [Brevibacterium casei]